MNSIAFPSVQVQIPNRVLHLCLGCSPDRLGVIPRAAEPHRALRHIQDLAEVLPTVFVVRDRAELCSGLRHPSAPVLKSGRSSALDAPGIERYLDAASTVVVTGLETSLEIYATVSELMFFNLWRVVLPEDAIRDRHPSAHGSCLHILAHGFKGRVEIAAVENLLAGNGQDTADPRTASHHATGTLMMSAA